MILEEFDMKEFLSMTKRDERKEGYETGVAAGRSEGLELGIERGRAAGITVGVTAFISTCQDLGLSKDETAARLMDKFLFSEEETTALMEKYWKE